MTRTSPPNALLAALDAGHLAYNTRQSTRGTPYAGFQLACGQRGRLRSFTALLEADQLRLTLYDPFAPPRLPGEVQCLGLQAAFPIARLYQNAGQPSRLELTLAVPVRGAALDFALIEQLLVHLAHNAEELEGLPSAASHRAPQLAPLDPAISLADSLTALGLSNRRVDGAFVVDMQLPRLPVSASFHVYHLGNGWLRIAAHFTEPTLPLGALPECLIMQLQQWAPVGRFTAARIVDGRLLSGHLDTAEVDATLGCEVACPALGRDVLDIIEAGLHAAVQLLGTAYSQATAKSG